MNSESAEILVVLPTLGQRILTLAETLSSVKAQTDQVNLRLVVVLPTSASQARQLVLKAGGEIIDDPGTGMSAAINAGISASKGELYYAWMGDDDLFRPQGLSVLKNLLENDSRAVVAYGACDYIDESGKILSTNRAGALAKYILAWGPDLVPHPGSLMRLKDLVEVGGYSTGLKFAMDLDVLLKLKKKGVFLSTRKTVSAFRWHPDSLTVANRTLSSAESEAVKREHLSRWVRPLSFLWVRPVRWASSLAARGLSSRV